MPIKAEMKQIWRCQYCNRPLFSEANCRRHEKEHCSHEDSPRVKNCEHEWETAWALIFGTDNDYEPDYDFCKICGIKA